MFACCGVTTKLVAVAGGLCWRQVQVRQVELSVPPMSQVAGLSLPASLSCLAVTPFISCRVSRSGVGFEMNSQYHVLINKEMKMMQ